MADEPQESEGLGIHDWMPAWVSLVHAGTTLTAGLDAHLQEQLGISLPEQDLLKQLDVNGGALTLGALARRLFFSKAGMTKMVDRLERAGLVRRERSDQDRRSISAVLTDDGLQAVRRSRELLMAWVWENFRAHLDDRQMVALRDSLRALLEGLGHFQAQQAHLRGEAHEPEDRRPED